MAEAATVSGGIVLSAEARRRLGRVYALLLRLPEKNEVPDGDLTRGAPSGTRDAVPTGAGTAERL